MLNNIPHAHGAGFLHGGRRGCLRGTRKGILGEIELWTKTFDNSPVLWLNGLAGTGKSTIAQTIAERIFAHGQLGASFFCSRDSEDRGNIRFIFPTLAFQLAYTYPEFRSKLVQVTQSDPQVTNGSLCNQMDRLLVQPLRSSGISTVITIDALDECRDEQPASTILSVLGQFIGEIPKVKFIITSRPEPRIQAGFRLLPMVKATDTFALHNIKSDLIDSDIRLFLEHNLMGLVDHQGGSSKWPTEEDLNTLCQRASRLFMYVVATVKFLSYKGSTPQEQLDLLLASPESSTFEGNVEFEQDTTLDSIYAATLQEAFKETNAEDDLGVRSTLGAVVLAASPLSPSAIATLLGVHINVILCFLSPVQSLLILHDNPTHPVHPFHKSFPDFITDSTRCLSKRFYISVPDHQTELLACCLELMNQWLEENVCNLLDVALNYKADDLQDEINDALQYACMAWHKHLVGAHQVPAIISSLHHFLENKFLLWLETLSILGATREAVQALNIAKKWLKVCFVFWINVWPIPTQNRQIH